MTIELRIEEFLLLSPGDGWVRGKDLCARFDLNDRQLRKVGNQEGLCSAFAISGDKGFKHVKLASRLEYKQFKHRLRKHAINELRRVAKLDHRRNHVYKTTKNPQFLCEANSGQGLMFAMPSSEPPF